VSAPLADRAARERAIRDHSAHLAVEAGAGTGKTTLLVDRIVHALARGEFEIRQLAAITFTRKAAGELRARLRVKLAEAARGASGEERKRLEAARRELPHARVSTIHSFCQRILRQHPLRAGLDPDYAVTAENRQREELEALWARWLDESAPLGADEPLGEALDRGASLESLFEAAASLAGLPGITPPPAERGPSDEEVWRRVVRGLGSLAHEARDALRDGQQDTLADGLVAATAEFARLEALPPVSRVRWLARQLRSTGGRLGFLFPVPGLRKNSGRKGAYVDPGMLDELRAKFADWREREVPELLRGRLGEIAAAAGSALADFLEWSRRKRLEAGRLAQGDLLEEARRLLSDESNGVVDRLCRDIKALMIDEYQDTDPVQAAIVEQLLSRERAPRLFLVGDPKQSIYRFRHADVLTYLAQARSLEQSGGLERISVNFRSRPELIGIINAVAGEVFESFAADSAQADWHPLAPADLETDRREGPSLVVATVGEPDEEPAPRADELARREAGVLAAQLSRAHGEGYEWRDMAVLFSGTGRLALLEEQLDAVGVPYRQEKSHDFFRRVEVAELSHLATAIADPWDEVAVVALLRSRLFGLEDSLLLRHRDEGGEFRAVGGPRSGEQQVLAALSQVSGWHSESGRRAPPELLEDVVRQTKLLVLLARLPDGRRASANVRKLLDHAAEHWRGGGLGIVDFARWLRMQVRAAQVRESESPSAETEDRVSLLTVHAAKGMQWHVVGLFDVHGGTRAGKPTVVVDRQGGAGAGSFAIRLTSAMRTARYDRLVALDEMQDLAERARLLYVALTRARDRLVIPVPPPDRSRVFDGSFEGLLRRSPTWIRWADAVTRGEHPAAPDVEAAGDPGTLVEQPHRPGRKPSRAERAEARERRADFIEERNALLVRADDVILSAPSDLLDSSFVPDSGATSGREIGEAVHAALEWLALDEGRVLDDACERALEKVGIDSDPEPLERVRRMVRFATGSEAWRRSREARRCIPEAWLTWHTRWEELPSICGDLLARRQADAGRRPPEREACVIVEGFADLVFGDDESLTVVDYKTDPFDSDEGAHRLARTYAPQVELYRRALLALPGVREVRAVLILLGGAAPSEIDLPELR
jgi:ATP-dependent helicase/nuclease subunit A